MKDFMITQDPLLLKERLDCLTLANLKYYSLLVNGLLPMDVIMNKNDMLMRVNSVFTPNTPVEIQDLFAGRQEQLKKIHESFLAKGCHIIIYGDRGVGKSSLANIVKFLYSHQTISCIKVSCDPTENFNDVWRKIFKQLIIMSETVKHTIGFNSEEIKDEFTYDATQIIGDSNNNLTSSEVIQILKNFNSNQAFLFILDEFDRLEDKGAKQKFTSLIKELSDNPFNVTIMLVGIADSIEELVESHRSLERCLKQVYLPKMSKMELADIINKGLEYLEMTIDEDVKSNIISSSEGFPQYTHLISKYAAISAIDRHSKNITVNDFKNSVQKALEETQETTKRAYQKATSNGKDKIHEKVLIASAIAETDNYDCFTNNDIKVTLKEKMNDKFIKRSYLTYLNDFYSDERGHILKNLSLVSRINLNLLTL
jgi:energy-coupling factor transporter ATP-binding protein EcfA2